MIESDQKNFNDPHPYDDEINLRELFNVIWEGKKLIILITSVVAISTIVFSLMLPNYYSSESVLVARDSQSSAGLSQYSGLASLAGVSLPSSGATPVSEVMEIIRSREFVKHLITFENVLPSIMAAKTYDAASQELYFDPEIYDAKTKTWIREISKNKGTKPSYIEAHKEYLTMLSISQDKKTGLISIKIEHISPIFAKDFLALVIKEANTLNREIDIDSSSKALSYLKIELSQTSLVEIKKSINQLIEAQLETRMMASIYDEYSLISLEPPFIPEEKSRPGRSFMVILGTILGGIFSVIIVLIRHYSLGKGTINKQTTV
jgi:uncharacterized protein involved in exopolysaccharide biosynthesis